MRNDHFEMWWNLVGSGIPLKPGMDHEMHAKAVAKLAFNHAVFLARSESLKSEQRESGGVGARNCVEISASISELHSK